MEILVFLQIHLADLSMNLEKCGLGIFEHVERMESYYLLKNFDYLIQEK